MSKAYWRIIQDEIEAKGWTVTRAVKPKMLLTSEPHCVGS